MTNAARRHFLAALGATALTAACTPARQIASTETDEPRGGIGGTGIVGTLTGFGSLLINGKRVVLDDRTEILGIHGALSQSDLSIGQALSLEAETVGGTLVARRVLVADPVVGHIEAVSADRRSLRVEGVPVLLDRSIQLNASTGDRVTVSGLWRGEGVVSTRIAPAPSGLDALSGVLGRDASGGYTIGTTPVAMRTNVGLPDIGSFAIMRGHSEDGIFAAQSISPGRFVGAAGPLTNLSVEGYLSPINAAPGYQLDGLGHSFDAAAELGAFAQKRTLFEGPYVGTFKAETGIALPSDASRRAHLLASVLNGSLPKSARVSTRG